MTKMTRLNDRVAWAIHYCKEKHNLSWPGLAIKLGTNRNTLAKYAQNLGEYVKGSVIDALGNKCGLNPSWLITGLGEPFPGARKAFPEACGLKIEKQSLDKEFIGQQEIFLPFGKVSDPVETYGEDVFGQAVSHLRKIFDSRDPTFTQAIVAHLNTFARAIDREEKNRELRNKIKSLEKRIGKLESHLRQKGIAAQGDISTDTTTDLNIKRKGG
jgi:hypothetical protein